MVGRLEPNRQVRVWRWNRGVPVAEECHRRRRPGIMSMLLRVPLLGMQRSLEFRMRFRFIN